MYIYLNVIPEMKLLDNKECCVNVYRVFGQGARLFVKLVNQNQTPSHEGIIYFQRAKKRELLEKPYIIFKLQTVLICIEN